jgi:hypothetical protein
MSEHAPRSHRPGGGYEKSDFAFGPVLAVAAGLSAAVAAVLLFILWLLGFFAARLPAPAAPAPAPAAAVRSGPREPRLQVDGIREMRQMLAEEEARLSGYGWVDRQRGTVRIPVARAMELILERGLPGAPPGGGTPAAGPGGTRR